MSKKRLHLLIILLVLSLAMLACGIFGGKEDEAVQEVAQPEISAPEEVAPPAPEAEEPEKPAEQSEEQVGDQPPPPDSPPPSTNLGDEYRSAEGGFSFRPIPDWKLEEDFGIATLDAPNADPEYGPFIMIVGGTNEEEKTTEDLYNEFTTDMDKSTQIISEHDIMVGGVQAKRIDIASTPDGEPVAGSVVVVAVSPTQQFSMMGFAKRDDWLNIVPLYDSVLASVKFFEPEAIDFAESEVGDEDEGFTGDPLDSGIESSADLPPGGFAYFISTDDGYYASVQEGNVQDRPNAFEHVIEFVSQDQEQTLTLYLPFDMEIDFLVVVPFDANSDAKAPSAFVSLGTTLYTATDGFVWIENIVDNVITGEFYFTATTDNGNTAYITGFFKEIPLN